jgi:NTF2 fold immunity protein
MMSKRITIVCFLILTSVVAGCRKSAESSDVAGSRKSDKPSESRLTAQEAVAIAESGMKEKFPDSFEEHKPYIAEWQDGIWWIHGTLPKNYVGGTPEAKVRDSDGKVLEVYHTQ